MRKLQIRMRPLHKSPLYFEKAKASSTDKMAGMKMICFFNLPLSQYLVLEDKANTVDSVVPA